MKCGEHVGKSHEKPWRSWSRRKSLTVAMWRDTRMTFHRLKKLFAVARENGTHKIVGASVIYSFSQLIFCHSAIWKWLGCICGTDAGLDRYHAKDIDKWEGGECDFHPQVLCSCGNCDDAERKCIGKAYHTSQVLSCDLHSLAYEIGCNHRADHAADIIDPELGRGHSNACEATFTVFPKFRPKDVALQRLHYQASTNLALVQSSMMYLFGKHGVDYHWMPDLFQRMGLPLLDGMKEQVSWYHAQYRYCRKSYLQTVYTIQWVNVIIHFWLNIAAILFSSNPYM